MGAGEISPSRKRGAAGSSFFVLLSIEHHVLCAESGPRAVSQCFADAGMVRSICADSLVSVPLRSDVSSERVQRRQLADKMYAGAFIRLRRACLVDTVIEVVAYRYIDVAVIE